MTDYFYSTSKWRALCAAVAKRSRGICEAPGCMGKAVVVDHVVARKQGGADHVRNLRHLCRTHDNQVKERADGTRRSGGILSGCDASGVPTDPAHPWNASHTGGRSIAGALEGDHRPEGRLRSKFKAR